MPTIHVLDRDRAVDCPPGECVLFALLDAGVNVLHACGGNGYCGTCNVEIVEGLAHLAPPSEAERTVLSKIKRQGEGVRLACQCAPTGDIRLRIAP